MIEEKEVYRKVFIEKDKPKIKGYYFTDEGFSYFDGEHFFGQPDWWLEKESAIVLTQEDLKQKLILFLDSIREYEKESFKSLHTDERESYEFVDIYFNK